MKRILFAIAAAAAVSAHAELKFATVDMLKLLRNHPDYERNERLLESTDKDYQKKVDAIKSEGEALQTEGRKLMEQHENPMLSDKAKVDLKKKLTEIQKQLSSIEQRYRAEAMRCQQDLRDLRQRLLKSSTDDLRERIAKFAESNGYDVVLDTNATAFSKASLDVTDEVLVAMGVDPKKAKGVDEGK